MTTPQADPDPTDLEAEGLPDLDVQPPGIGGQNEVEAMVPPRDHPMAVEDRVTPAEQAQPETLDERLAREQPEAYAGEPGVDRPAGRLVEPGPGLLDGGDGEQSGQVTSDRGGLSAEEAAVHLVDEGGDELGPVEGVR